MKAIQSKPRCVLVHVAPLRWMGHLKNRDQLYDFGLAEIWLQNTYVPRETQRNRGDHLQHDLKAEMSKNTLYEQGQKNKSLQGALKGCDID